MTHTINPTDGVVKTNPSQQPIIIVNKENPTPPVFHYYLSIGLGILVVVLGLFYFYHKYEQMKRENDEQRIKAIVKQAMTEWYNEMGKTSQKITEHQNIQSRVPMHE